MAAAKKEVTDQLENVSNKYFVKLHDAYTKILTRSREITKYAEIKKDDAQKVYAKNKGIVASNEDFFVEK